MHSVIDMAMAIIIGSIPARGPWRGEDHLRHLLREYVDYYNAERVHTSISDAPEGRPTQDRPSGQAKVIGLPRVGGLHHRYVWAQAA